MGDSRAIIRDRCLVEALSRLGSSSDARLQKRPSMAALLTKSFLQGFIRFDEHSGPDQHHPAPRLARA
jgi:hypothetical protein